MISTNKENKKTARRLKSLSISKMLPNITTLFALCAGLSSIRFAMNEQLEYAVVSIIVAAILDTLDGRLARMLGTSSEFGAVLDSLSDFVCFGVSPSLILYIISLQQWGKYGWALVLFFSMCMGFRLARFNSDSEAPGRAEWKKKYFKGVPAPAGALLVLWGLIISFATDIPVYEIPYVHAFLLLAVGFMLISKIPTYSGKGTDIPQEKLRLVLAGVAIFIALVIATPWVSLSMLGVAYLATIPLSYKEYHKILAQEAAGKS